MTKHELFRIWAPDGARWVKWVKPVLFAHAELARVTEDPALPDGLLAMADASLSRLQLVPHEATIATYRSMARTQNSALILELPGASSVINGVAVASHGFRPIPLFNAWPATEGPTIVNMWPMVDALVRTAPALAAIQLPEDAPPAFLLDADRKGEGKLGMDTRIDNRSICTRSDFPTSAQLIAHGIEHVVVVRLAYPSPLAFDLADVLLGLQTGGVKIHTLAIADNASPEAFTVKRPSLLDRFNAAFERFGMVTTEGAFGGRYAAVAASS